MTGFLDLPPEILEHALLELDPLDVASASQVCRLLSELVYAPSNEVFWQRLYLRQPLDDPRACRTPLGLPAPPTDYKRTLQRIMRARTVVRNPAVCRPDERTAVLTTLLALAQHTPPMRGPLDDSRLSLNLVWLAALLRPGAFLDAAPWPPAPAERAARAHLHTRFGLSARDYRAVRRAEARARVYAARYCAAANDFGPFLLDGSGRVDWEHVCAIHHAMSTHLVPGTDAEPTAVPYTIFPMSLPFTQSIIPADLDLDAVDDWAGIAGDWDCAFCFMDHRDLISYNSLLAIQGDPSEPLMTALYAQANYVDVFGGVKITLEVTSTEDDPAHPNRPRLHFTGSSDSGTSMAGWVAVTEHGDIRWHFESGQHGDNVWSSEGIQVGNVRSLFGVLGTWTTVTHDEHDPFGPFWMRKR